MKLYLGPCVLESSELAHTIASTIVEKILPLQKLQQTPQVIFKGSFDKANRTSINSYRGPGIKAGLKLLADIRDRYSLPLLTDFHTPEQAMEVAEVVDIVQIPAFLCRQTDMLIEGAKACKHFGRKLKIKKGQFLAPLDTKNIVEKAHHFLPLEDIILTERGSSFGYNNLIVDMASFQIMQSFGVQVVYDATHAVQCPGSAGAHTGGKREQIMVLAMAAVAAGADGIFLETHPHPEKALSDATTSWPLDKLPSLLAKLITLHQTVEQLQD
ncbi:MAG: 3-deoxy-8-phosphooctulonate synthase [Oligoflexia bacterium]|nr:3-deoxy-8-phosphooctulonate synthase [Oligoflexia bacterium]MBF0364003.1 3-deoxy-8-phosphooctulonate synthase [Oligoflexia bacterium]